MKITVFGGSGFLGSHVCDKLSDAGHQVTIFDLVPSRWLRPDQTMVTGDILDRDMVADAVRGAEAVFNFAGIADIGEANGRPLDTVRFNILGNATILDACREASVGRFIFASSVYVYSKSGGFYRCSKQACELYIEEYSTTYGLPYTILRYGSLYGPRADIKNAIYRFVSEAMNKGSIKYYGSGDALREYIHVEDAALSSVEILKEEYANSHIALTGAQQLTVKNLFKMISEIIGQDIKYEFENDPSNIHYEMTPYTFSPKICRKMSPRLHMDLGQGLLWVIEDEYRKSHPEMHAVSGYLVKEEK